MVTSTRRPAIQRILFRPPNVIARVGGSEHPMEAYEWGEDPAIHGKHATVVIPALTLAVLQDGSVSPYTPSSLRFADQNRVRPVAPFLELWAICEGQAEPQPLNLALLAAHGLAPADIYFSITIANLKAARRTGSPGDGFAARIGVRGDEHTRQCLLASSPSVAGYEPLVPCDKPIPMGWIQVIQPQTANHPNVDLSAIRIRYTPPTGEVYGPPSAGNAADPVTGKVHTYVRPENRFLNPKASWCAYVPSAENSPPAPYDTYESDAAGLSMGVVDDFGDGLVVARLTAGGEELTARARLMIGPPDFAPASRPFLSLADELADRELAADLIDASNEREINSEIIDLFRRVYETASLISLDMIRARAIRNNQGALFVNNLPQIDQRSMTSDDPPYADQTAELKPAMFQSAPGQNLPYTDIAEQAHRWLCDADSLLEYLAARQDRVAELVRPPYAAFKELPEELDEFAGGAGRKMRDPRCDRDQAHDMRMPPYMRDANGSALSLTRRQYRVLENLAAYLHDKAPSGGATASLQGRMAHLAALASAHRRNGGAR
jgi:hypothetical protein